jgi:hypothetical protein
MPGTRVLNGASSRSPSNVAVVTRLYPQGVTNADLKNVLKRSRAGSSAAAIPASYVAVMQRTDGTDNAREQRVDWFFTCDVWGSEPAIIEPAKCAELRWFDLSDLPARVSDYERLALGPVRSGRTASLISVGFEEPLR